MPTFDHPQQDNTETIFTEKLRTMVYCGFKDGLRGKTALIRMDMGVAGKGVVYAQFDDVETGYGYGWHPFDAASFQEVKENEPMNQVTFSVTKRERLRLAYEAALAKNETAFWFEEVEYNISYVGQFLTHLDSVLGPPKVWIGSAPVVCDMGQEQITTDFIDGRTKMGPWANMCLKCWDTYGVGKLGTGLGQHFHKRADGKWVKIGG